jgi:hypothetical protein
MALWKTAEIEIRADRWTVFNDDLAIIGVDLTAADFKLQVRDRKDGGFVRADLSTVTSGSAQGIRLIDVVTTGGVPTSRLGIRINEITMEAMAVATEAGEDGAAWWDLHITPSAGDKFVAASGRFIILAGSTQ